MKILCGGEVLSHELADALGQRADSLWNMYGPTETTIWSSVSQVAPDDEKIWIGQPIANTKFYVLSPSRELQPPGVVGELYIGGTGLARGYRSQDLLTKDRFVTHQFEEGPVNRLYRTGDLVRRFAHGRLEFLGRTDTQVKVRGYRIELGEIETALARNPSVKECAVVARPGADGVERLVGYLVPTIDHPANVSELKMYLRKLLPEYMVPSVLVTLDAFPLTANKKVDRNALPEPDHVRPDLATELVSPRTENETTLARIWEELLDIERVGINDNFFDLGGDSMLALRCVMRAKKAGLRIVQMSMFRHQTIAELAEAANQSDETIHADQGIVTGPTALTPAQLRFLYERKTPDPHYWNVAALMQATALDPEALGRALTAVLEHHDALRLRLTEVAGKWHQEIAGTTGDLPFGTHDLAHLNHDDRSAFIEQTCTSLQRSLNLSSGPLLQMAHFACGPDEPDRLFVTIHHFAVDGLTWSVFWEDFESAYRQAVTMDEVVLPSKTTSFQNWAKQLEKLVQTPRVADTGNEWLELPWNEIGTLPSDFEHQASDNTNASTEIVEVEFTADQATVLLGAGGDRRPDQVLIAALAQCLSEWTSSSTVLIDRLSHGRDAALETVDLTRTVGFTLSYNPLVLKISSDDSPSGILRSVANQIRESPEGFAFELLRFFDPDLEMRETLTQLPRSQVLFNYNGPKDHHRHTSIFHPAPESVGPSESPRGVRQYPLAVRATVDDILRVTFVYSRNLHRRATIETLANRFKHALLSILEDSSNGP